MIYVPLVTYLAVLFFALVVLTYAYRRKQNWFGSRSAIVATTVVGLVGVAFTIYRIFDLDRKGASLETWQLVAAPVIYGVGALVLLVRFRT